MAYVTSLANGARLALMVGFTLALANGIWARFNPNGNTLRQSVISRLGMRGAANGNGTTAGDGY